MIHFNCNTLIFMLIQQLSAHTPQNKQQVTSGRLVSSVQIGKMAWVNKRMKR